MFFYIEFLIALMVALFITAIIAAGLRKSASVRRYVSIFILILLAAWAGGLWLVPVGPDFAGVSVLTFVIVGIITALILAIGAYPYYPIFQREENPTNPKRPIKAQPVSGFFWLLLVILALAIIAGYLWPARIV
ncbi:hypothetical protein QA601_08170 [Chitinispirillales bacterium ANBcel5]|uniref:hypothetical protein n=1 Tax=Cellulosispirillum alkaliphilum TaxID=3039283 RepID=UPI002A4E6F99|nr:hypothetical protein [Chitinispirillales bacterium ANBcel5]